MVVIKSVKIFFFSFSWCGVDNKDCMLSIFLHVFVNMCSTLFWIFLAHKKVARMVWRTPYTQFPTCLHLPCLLYSHSCVLHTLLLLLLYLYWWDLSNKYFNKLQIYFLTILRETQIRLEVYSPDLYLLHEENLTLHLCEVTDKLQRNILINLWLAVLVGKEFVRTREGFHSSPYTVLNSLGSRSGHLMWWRDCHNHLR